MYILEGFYSKKQFFLLSSEYFNDFVTYLLFLGKNKKLKQQALALQQEMKILSKLDHPNIIKYLGTEYSHHTMRIFLELANEGSLKDALTEFGE